MNPRYLECTECSERLFFPEEYRLYYLDLDNNPSFVSDKDSLQMLLDPIWCFDCLKASWAEYIPSLRQIEQSLAMVKNDQVIDFPFCSQYVDKEFCLNLLNQYVSLILKRREKEKCVLCAGTNYEMLGGRPVKLRHDQCDYGVFKPIYTLMSYNHSYNPSIYNLEGYGIGQLSSWEESVGAYKMLPKHERFKY